MKKETIFRGCLEKKQEHFKAIFHLTDNDLIYSSEIHWLPLLTWKEKKWMISFIYELVWKRNSWCSFMMKDEVSRLPVHLLKNTSTIHLWEVSMIFWHKVNLWLSSTCTVCSSNKTGLSKTKKNTKR